MPSPAAETSDPPASGRVKPPSLFQLEYPLASLPKKTCSLVHLSFSLLETRFRRTAPVFAFRIDAGT